MSKIEKLKIISGVYWIAIPKADLYVLCACPADIMKHMMKKGLIKTIAKDGFTYETGPNAILLSDVLVQNGYFSNLGEFPILQIFYRQGMLIPKHPNNKGIRPILMGTKDQLNAQMEYIYRGNYGLVNHEEILETGTTKDKADEIMRMKINFAFGKISRPEDLLDSLVISKEPVEIRNKVFIKRLGLNKYEFQYEGETETVDLNLPSNEQYDPPFELGFHQIKREYFSVIHSGEGDGWDVNRPSMASILTFQGKIYLIDAGPNLLNTLTALGISINEIEGIFHTHAHDDHFAGLTTLIRADHKLKYYATPLVRSSVSKKLRALMSWNEDVLYDFFEIHDLEFDVWNNINSLEVMPILSPPPLETNVLSFRALWDGGYKVYSHLADLTSLDVLKKMVNDSNESGISKEFFDEVKFNYLRPATLKKIDIGGGLIHGNAEDFKMDKSDKIIMSHTSNKFTDAQREIGSRAPFGMVDVLIPANQEYNMQYAYKYLSSYFQDSPREDLRILLNCSLVTFNAGSILIKKNTISENTYLVLTGTIEMINTNKGINRTLYAGTMVGELSCLTQTPSMETYCAKSSVWALKIPNNLFIEFVKKNELKKSIEKKLDKIKFFHDTWLFGEMVSYHVQNKIVQKMTTMPISKNQEIPEDKFNLVMLYKGGLELLCKNKCIEEINAGSFCGEGAILYDSEPNLTARAKQDSIYFQIPKEILLDIPVVHWKLLETYKKRQQLMSDLVS